MAAAPKATDGLTAAAHRVGPCQAKEGVKREGRAAGERRSRFRQTSQQRGFLDCPAAIRSSANKVYKPISCPSSRRRLLATRSWKVFLGLMDVSPVVLESWEGISEGVRSPEVTWAVASGGRAVPVGDAGASEPSRRPEAEAVSLRRRMRAVIG